MKTQGEAAFGKPGLLRFLYGAKYEEIERDWDEYRSCPQIGGPLGV